MRSFRILLVPAALFILSSPTQASLNGLQFAGMNKDLIGSANLNSGKLGLAVDLKLAGDQLGLLAAGDRLSLSGSELLNSGLHLTRKSLLELSSTGLNGNLPILTQGYGLAASDEIGLNLW